MILIKVYAPGNVAPEIHRVEKFPAGVGRAFDNTIILTDTSVSAHHAVLERGTEGRLHLRDLQSTNGILEGGRKVEVVDLDQKRSIRIGHVWIETQSSSEPLEDTASIDFNQFDLSESKPWSHRKGVTIAIFLTLVSLLVRWLEAQLILVSWTPYTVLTQSLSFSLAAIGFAVALSLFSKVHLRRYQFYSVFATIMSFAILAQIHFAAANLVTFNINRALLAQVLEELVSATILFLGFLRLSQLLFPEAGHRTRAMFIAGVLIAFLTTSYGLKALNKWDPTAGADVIIAMPLRTFHEADRGLTRAFKKMDEAEEKVIRARKEILDNEAERLKD